MLDLPRHKPGRCDGTTPLPKQFRPEKVPKTLKPKRAGVPARLRVKILNRDQYTCRYCGKGRVDTTTGEVTEFHIDHVVPVADGGRTCEVNCVTACAACNLGKGRGMKLIPRPIDTPPDKPDPNRPEAAEWREKKDQELRKRLPERSKKK